MGPKRKSIAVRQHFKKMQSKYSPANYYNMINAEYPWKSRYELPVIKKLNLRFDIERLKAELKNYSGGRLWDSLGSEYASLCETHTRLPKMFFKEDELKNVSHVCDLDWQHTSYQQLTLTEFDPDYNLLNRKEHSGSCWDQRIAKKAPDADERWYRKLKMDTPDYLKQILTSIKGAHRARFARLAAKSEVKPHIDYDTLYGIRIHIPIETNENCVNGGWDREGHEVIEHLPADGSAWFVNPGVKHFARNDGNSPRTHLIVSVDSQELVSSI